MQTQNYSNHVRWFPLFHFVVSPLLFVLLIWNAVRLYQVPSWDAAMNLVFVFTVILVALAARMQALKAQDRVIRLEERLRYAALLSPELAAKASELPLSRVIALRFASDSELESLIAKVINKELATPKDIKLAIKDWRGDFVRV
ncbi:MAG: DUF6526 family protein [Pyrinomonadaceae bacterium]|nr:DUF6526 family protein [Pyrinomonadaceae bacterium]